MAGTFLRESPVSNVIPFPTRLRVNAVPLIEEHQGYALVVQMPPRQVIAPRAIAELGRFLNCEIKREIPLGLALPPMVQISTFGNGIEFYDIKSSRPKNRNPDETLDEVERWARYWYFCVFEKDGQFFARYIDKCHPDERRLKRHEGVIKTASSLSSTELQRFVDALANVN